MNNAHTLNNTHKACQTSHTKNVHPYLVLGLFELGLFAGAFSFQALFMTTPDYSQAWHLGMMLCRPLLGLMILDWLLRKMEFPSLLAFTARQ